MIDLAPTVLALNAWPLVQGLVMTLFVLTSLLLLLVILIQEGKGGGIAGAFGGAAAETFGVKAGTVNRFTAILATVFMGLALLHAGIASATGGSVIKREAPVPSGEILPGGGTPPPAAPGTPDESTTPPAMQEPGMSEAPPAMEGDGAMQDAAMGDAAMGTEAPPAPPAETPAPPAMGG